MTVKQKDTIDSTFTWVFRGIIIYFFTMISSRLDAIEKLQRKQDVQDEQIANMKSDINKNGAHLLLVDNKINRLERQVQFKRNDSINDNE